MKKLLVVVFCLMLANGISGCSPDKEALPEIPETPEQPKPNPGPEQPEDNDNSMKLQITIGSNTFTATLLDNETAKSFKALLPMTVNMIEHAGNEKYCNLPQSLPTRAINPGTIQNGDLMLFGSQTFVLFYKTFQTSYSYTRLGKVDNPAGLASALGSGNVTVTFELQQKQE